jgi:hypothetical protein
MNQFGQWLANAAFVALTVAGQQRTSCKDEVRRLNYRFSAFTLSGHLFPYSRLRLIDVVYFAPPHWSGLSFFPRLERRNSPLFPSENENRKLL